MSVSFCSGSLFFSSSSSPPSISSFSSSPRRFVCFRYFAFVFVCFFSLLFLAQLARCLFGSMFKSHLQLFFSFFLLVSTLLQNTITATTTKILFLIILFLGGCYRERIKNDFFSSVGMNNNPYACRIRFRLAHAIFRLQKIDVEKEKRKKWENIYIKMYIYTNANL